MGALRGLLFYALYLTPMTDQEAIQAFVDALGANSKDEAKHLLEEELITDEQYEMLRNSTILIHAN